MKRRVVSVVLAVALAVLGTAAVLVYVNRADARAVAGQQAVTVLVADRQIPSGTTGLAAKTMLRKETLPASSVSSDAVAEITPGQEGLVTSTDLAPGQVLLKSALITATQATGGLAIPDGKVAVTITVCGPEAVAGNIKVGSEVAVFGTLVTGATDVSAQPNCTGQHKQQFSKGLGNTRVVIPKVRVIGLGPAARSVDDDAKATGVAAKTSANQTDMTMVTFAVDQDDAERLILLTQTSLPYLALLGPSAKVTPDTHIVEMFPPAKTK